MLESSLYSFDHTYNILGTLENGLYDYTQLKYN